MRVLYFAAVRQGIGRGEEVVSPPESVATAGDLLAWLRGRGGQYEAALAGRVCIAVDEEHADAGASIAGAGEVAFFPPVTGG